MKIKLKGHYQTQTVWLNDKELTPDRSLKVRNHSPDGFSWGYGGSGPSQLALAICLELYDEKTALNSYMAFKWEWISNLPITDFETSLDVDVPNGNKHRA